MKLWPLLPSLMLLWISNKGPVDVASIDHFVAFADTVKKPSNPRSDTLIRGIYTGRDLFIMNEQRFEAGTRNHCIHSITINGDPTTKNYDKDLGITLELTKMRFDCGDSLFIHIRHFRDWCLPAYNIININAVDGSLPCKE